MSILLDRQLREHMPHDATAFPITYFHNELQALPNWAGPLHWHPDFEVATAECGVLEYQVGDQHMVLEAGDSIFVNRNVLHGIRQLSGDTPDPMPNIVFSGSLVAPETSIIYRKYILPIAQCDSLPCVVFRHNSPSHSEIHYLIKEIYKQMTEDQAGCELIVQRHINRIFEYLSAHFAELPKTEATRMQICNQVRLQKMLTFIYENYTKPITLNDIARAADISRSEAGRCFHSYLNCSPVDMLIQYRLQAAHQLLYDGTQTIQQISYACGFHSTNYFNRRFKQKYGCTPKQSRNTGK